MLNKKLPFAEVFGRDPDGCKYIQDDIKYTVEGKPLPADKQTDEGKKSLKDKKEAAAAVLKAAEDAEKAGNQ